VTGLAQPHLGKLFGVDKETICFYLIHCKLLNKAQGTVESKEWEGFVLTLPDSTQRGSRSQAKPNQQRVKLQLVHSKAGLGRQTAQYFLELSAPLTSTDTIASKERRSGTSNQSFPQMWPYLNGMVCPKPQQAPPKIRIMKNQRALGPPRPRLEPVKLSANMKSELRSRFFNGNGSLAVSSEMKGSINALFRIKFEGSETDDLRLMITFILGKSWCIPVLRLFTFALLLTLTLLTPVNIDHPHIKPILKQLYGTEYIDESREDIRKLGILIGGTEVQPLHTDFEPSSFLHSHTFAPRSFVLGFSKKGASGLHLAVQKDQLVYIE
jgi:hypothetical protein